MKKFGWEFQTAWKAVEDACDLAGALEIFRRHFGLYGDSESLEKAVFCCRRLGDFEQGLEQVSTNFASHRDYQPFAREAFLFNYEFEVRRHMLAGDWQRAFDGFFWLMEDPAVIPAEFEAGVGRDLLEVCARTGAWERYLKEYKRTDLAGITSARRNVFRETRKRAFFYQINDKIRNGEYGSACELAAEARKAFPREIEFVRKQAGCMENSGQAESAIALLEVHLNSKTCWQANFDLAKLFQRAGNREKSLKQALLAFEKPGNLSGKTNLLLLLARLLIDLKHNDHGDVILNLVAKLRERSLLPVEGELAAAVERSEPAIRQMRVEDLYFYLKMVLRSEFDDFDSTLPGYFSGRIDFMSDYDDCFAVLSEQIESCFCLKSDLPENINACGGRIIFRLRETGFMYQGHFNLQAVDVIPDTIAARSRLEPDRLPFASCKNSGY